MVKMSQAKIAEIQKKKEAQQKGKPGRVGIKREATQAEIDARKKAMYDARMEAHKKNKTGPFRTVPGRQRKKFKTIDQIIQEQTRGPIEISRTNRAGGGLMEATARLKKQGLKNGGVARGCGAIMSDRRKKTKIV